MTKIKIKKLIWQDWNKEHVKQKHNVDVAEAEEAAKNSSTHIHGYKGRYVVLGRTGTRILAVVVTRQKQSEYLLITARDADKRERRRVYEKEN